MKKLVKRLSASNDQKTTDALIKVDANLNPHTNMSKKDVKYSKALLLKAREKVG